MERFVSIDSLKMHAINTNQQIFSTAYLAPISYYKTLLNGTVNVLDIYEYYEKQSYRNRCNIAAANGVQSLSIPVESKAKTFVRDIKISKHSHWQVQHWRSIQAAYQSSPFFEYYIDDLYPFFEKEWLYLYDLNMALHLCIEQLLDVASNLQFSNCYVDDINTIDWRNSIHPKKVCVASIQTYYQVFANKNGFQSDMSILDLLFNKGNESILILQNK
jgi:hypothetical protein